jgi:hypothetical protein
MRLRLILLALLVAVGLSNSWVAPAEVAAGAEPIQAFIFVHGYSPAPCPGSSEVDDFTTTVDFLRARGFGQKMITAGYYRCDTGADVRLEAYGHHDAYPGGDGQSADIRHFASELAWMIWTDYSSQGHAVGLVGHSMGGLIVRWMLARVAAHDPTYPSRLFVPEAVTLGSPFGGAGFAAFCPNLQCQEMAPGSSFLEALDRDPAPQASGGTRWTVLGSASDTVVRESSALDMLGAYRIGYLSPAYGHGDYPHDVDTAWDARITYRAPGDSQPRVLDDGPHTLELVTSVLQGLQLIPPP